MNKHVNEVAELTDDDLSGGSEFKAILNRKYKQSNGKYIVDIEEVR